MYQYIMLTLAFVVFYQSLYIVLIVYMIIDYTMLHVFWHKNPDTDAILSAMIYVKFVQSQWFEATAYRLWEINNETKYVLSMIWWNQPELATSLPAWSSVALTDHNEKSQSIDNIDELKVEFIIDHHKFNFVTSEPTEIIVKPIASTCSVIYWLWKNAWLELPKDVAKAMMAWIISDTLYFRSPTTTDYDKFIFNELQEIAQFDNPEEFSLAMFDAKSNLWDISVRDLITLDYKVFETNGKRFAWWTIETTSPSYALHRKDEIVADLVALKQEQKLDFVFLSVVDILHEKNITIVWTKEDEYVIKSVFGADTINNLADLWWRISRKKQLAWPLTDYFSA